MRKLFFRVLVALEDGLVKCRGVLRLPVLAKGIELLAQLPWRLVGGSGRKIVAHIEADRNNAGALP
jgi:hypothetical protein